MAMSTIYPRASFPGKQSPHLTMAVKTFMTAAQSPTSPDVQACSTLVSLLHPVLQAWGQNPLLSLHLFLPPQSPLFLQGAIKTFLPQAPLLLWLGAAMSLILQAPGQPLFGSRADITILGAMWLPAFPSLLFWTNKYESSHTDTSRTRQPKAHAQLSRPCLQLPEHPQTPTGAQGHGQSSSPGPGAQTPMCAHSRHFLSNKPSGSYLNSVCAHTGTCKLFPDKVACP